MSSTPPNARRPIDRLIEVMARLRDPNGGCPWDLEQDFDTIAPFTIEEAYEVADAIRSGDRDALKNELGDLLFQVVYYAQMSREEGGFDFESIAGHEADKMIGRHPHVFGTDEVADSETQTRAWEAHKATERARKADGAKDTPSALDGVALALPALIRAEKLAKRAARVGFDWPTVDEVFAKIDEELGEVRDEIAVDASKERLADEVGDLLFSVANLARKLGLDPEACLRGTNDKFTRRFHSVEAALAERGRSTAESDLGEMDALWNASKGEENDST